MWVDGKMRRWDELGDKWAKYQGNGESGEERKGREGGL